MPLATYQNFPLHVALPIRNARIKARMLCRRQISSGRSLPSDAYKTSGARMQDETSDTRLYGTPRLTRAQRERLDSAIRVDQAGEIAANYIYMGQIAVLGRNPTLRPVLQDMWDQEKKHLWVMNRLQLQHQIRPTALSEVAKAAGYALGFSTALMGKEAAMACTEAVETVIGEHYDDQLKDMEDLPSDHPSVPLLRDVIREFRDDELEHLDTAVEYHSQRAPAHAFLSTIIGAGCKVAIEMCKRI